MEAAGAVFLPAAGERDEREEAKIFGVDTAGFYWTSSNTSTDRAWIVQFGNDNNYPFTVSGGVNCSRRGGKSVRLVRPVE